MCSYHDFLLICVKSAPYLFFFHLIVTSGLPLNIFEPILVNVYRLAMHSERTNRHKADDQVEDGAVPAYLLDRDQTARAKVNNFFKFQYTINLISVPHTIRHLPT